MLKIGSIATVESISAKENMTSLKIICKGVGKNGREFTDFKSFVGLFGQAHEKAVDLNVGDFIKILDFGVTTKFVNNTNYTNCNIYDIEIIPGENIMFDNDEMPFS